MSETCRNGHPITDGSTYIENGRHYCRECRRLRKLRSYHKRAATRAAKPKVKPDTWINDEGLVTQAHKLWDEGYSAAAVATAVGNGCTKGAVLSIARRRKWNAHPQCKPVVPILGHSSAQLEFLQAKWSTEESVSSIVDAINAIGPKHFTEVQLRKLAQRLGLKRLKVVYHKPLNRTYPKRSTGIPIPLREVYQRAAQLDLPRSKRGDIYALNNAIKRVQPGHPGFVLADHQPTRLTWTS